MGILLTIFHIVWNLLTLMPAFVVFGSIIPNPWLSWLAVIAVIAFSWRFEFPGSILGIILWIAGVPLVFIFYPLPFAIFYTVIFIAKMVDIIIRFIKLSKNNKHF